MAKPFIKYRDGYKYQLAVDYSIKIKMRPKKVVAEKFIELDMKGNLTILEGYAWDGASGPVRDTKQNMRASLIHDALYQLMRLGRLKADIYKEKADKLFEKVCIEDGVTPATAEMHYLVLRAGGKDATDPKNKKPVHRAPKRKSRRRKK